MFISREEIKARSGYDVSQNTLLLAQTMVEAFVGKDEAEVEDASDVSLLAKAVLFQAIYIRENPEIALEQAGIKTLSANESTTTFDTARFAPFISPWVPAVVSGLSWRGTRSVKVGATNPVVKDHFAAREWFYG